MTVSAGVLLAVAAGFAVGTWVAIARHAKRVEYVCKPVALGALIGAVLLLDAADPSQRAWFVVALAFSLAGDIFLMLPQEGTPNFLLGLGSFLLGHVYYVVGFAVVGWSVAGIVGAAAGVAVLGTVAGYPIVRALVRSERQRPLAAPVTAYLVVISVMVASAVATANPWAITGALLFMFSDWLIGYSRFVRPLGWAPVTIIVTYHLAQAGLALSLVWGR